MKDASSLVPTRKFTRFLESMPAARQAKILKAIQKSFESMPSGELPEAREKTRLQLSEVLGVHQSEVSKIERRSGIRVSTLVESVEALGGHVEIRAVFPDRAVWMPVWKNATVERRAAQSTEQRSKG